MRMRSNFYRSSAPLLTFLSSATSLSAFIWFVLSHDTLLSSKSAAAISIIAAVFAGFYSVYFLRVKEQMRSLKRIFIIYSHKDAAVAIDLAKWLRENGYNPWLDTEEIAPGQRITQEISRGMMESSVAIFLSSQNVEVGSEYLKMEIELALDRLQTKDESYGPIIPIKLDDHPLPEALNGISWIDFRSSDAFERLDKGLKIAIDA